MNRGTFPELVKTELNRARSKHPGEQRSLHEAYAVILEEVDEFWDLVKSQKPDPNKVLDELVQISAMCQRAAEDVLKCEREELPPGSQYDSKGVLYVRGNYLHPTDACEHKYAWYNCQYCNKAKCPDCGSPPRETDKSPVKNSSPVKSLKGAKLMSDYDIYTQLLKIPAEEAETLIEKLQNQKLQILLNNPAIMGTSTEKDV